MKQYLEKVIRSGQNGLYLCQLPTGYGKSYATLQTIADWIRNSSENRKIIYLTTLTKNLPSDTLKEMLSDTPELYDANVLRLRSNLEEVSEKLPDLEIPDEFQTDSYQALLKAIDILKQAEQNRIRDAAYLDELQSRAMKAEFQFRREIAQRLCTEGKDKTQRLASILTKKQYRWIGVLYPAVFTDSRRVLFMTVKKFLSKNATLIEPSYDFLKSDMLQNAVILIDEFDATKQVVMEQILQTTLSAQSEYLALFRQLLIGLHPEQFSASVKESSGPELEKIIDEGQHLSVQYRLNLSYKTAESGIDNRQNFLFHDGSFHTVLQDGKQYIRTYYDSELNRVTINFDTKDLYYQKRSPDDIQLYRMLQDVQGYINRFRVFLFQWAEQFRKVINTGRNDTADEMTSEHAQRSILHALNLNEQQIEILLGELSTQGIKRKSDSLLPEQDFYTRGISIYELEDHDSHYDSTDLIFIRMYDTAEKVIRFLAERAIVFGISATAEAKTVLGNYNLEYLSNKLGSLYHQTDRDLLLRIRKEMQQIHKPYEEGNIRVHLAVLPERKEANDWGLECRCFMNDPEIADAAANAMIIVTDEPYFLQRYCRIFEVMCRFWKENSIRSLLCLGMKLPKQDPAMQESLLHTLMKYAAMDSGHSADKSSLVMLQSSNYEETKEALLADLSEGRKRFVISTYATIGAGQNLQYAVSDVSGFVQLPSCSDKTDKRYASKDFDALYLADITHLTVNTYDRISREDMLCLLAQIEELYHNGEINYRTKDQLIKLAFRARQSEKSYMQNPIYQTDSFRIRATQLVIQAVGRMCRTFVKNPDIHLFIDEKLLGKLDMAEMSRRIFPPEMQCLLNARKEIGARYSFENLRTLNLAERISTEGMWRIRKILSRGWSQESMKLWEQLRQIVLKYPTAPNEIHEQEMLVHELYVSSGTNQNSYLFSQYSDFNDVTIDFSGDATAFRNSERLKIEGASQQTAVWEMSESASGLPTILRYPGMNNYFVRQGFATHFEPRRWMMSPVLFHNIYKGSLGEVAGKFILEHERRIMLHAITDPERFEFFDFEMHPGIYVDFKNWKYTYLQDKETIRKEILRKLDEIGGKRVYVINLIASPGSTIAISHDERIIEIPGLLDENGNLIPDILNQIKREDYEE